MIREIRRDEAIRPWPLWIAIVLYLGMGSVAATLGFWVYWFPLALYLVQTQLRRRVSDFDLALPLSARRLWLTHVLALGLGGAMVLAGGFVLLVLLVWGPGAGAERIDGALRLGAGWVIAVAVLQSRRPALVRTLTGADDVLFCMVVLVVPGIVLLLDGRWVIALLALALVLAYRTWRTLPAAFTLVPLAAQPGDAAGRGTAIRHVEHEWTAAAATSGWRLRLELLRFVWGQRHWTWGLSFALGLLVATTLWDRTGVDLRLLHSVGVMFTLPMFAFLLSALPRLSFLDPLPIRRGPLFAALFFPTGGAFALGCAALFFLFGPEVTGLALPLVLLIGTFPSLLLLAIALRVAQNARAASWLSLKRVVGLLLILTVLVMAISPTVQGALDVFLPLVDEIQAGTPAVWLMTMLLLLGAYALARASFERFEIVVLGQTRRDTLEEELR